MELLNERQTFKIFLDMNNFMLDPPQKADERTRWRSWLGSFTARNKITGSAERETAAS